MDRLLALSLRLRYRQVVTLKRVQLHLALCWIGTGASGLTGLYNIRIPFMISFVGALVFVIITTFCYIKIYIKLFHHQAQVQDHIHQQQWREPTEYFTLREDCDKRSVSATDITCLLYSFWRGENAHCH